MERVDTFLLLERPTSAHARIAFLQTLPLIAQEAHRLFAFAWQGPITLHDPDGVLPDGTVLIPPSHT